jgi:hypothetical protein
VDRLLPKVHGALHEVLTQLKTRPTFAEQWPDTYQQGLAKGKTRILKLEHIRQDSYTLDNILQQDKDIYEWWTAIRQD